MTELPDGFRLADPPVRDRRSYNVHQSRNKRNGVFTAEQVLPPTTALGVRLRELRTRAGFTQAQMAKLVGYGPNCGGRVSDWELGHHLPTLPILHRYASGFAMTVSELLDGVL
jgi:DNA-binding XRE family transcriptional regulator